MEWRGQRESDQVEDRRANNGGSFPMGRGNIGFSLIMMIARTFGIKGMVVAAILALGLWKMGLLDPLQLITGGGSSSVSSSKAPISAEDQERFDFVKVILARTEEIWTTEFQRVGRVYNLPKMAVFRGQTGTGCGVGGAEMGPFYCPADQTVYIDLSFYDELAQTFQSSGDFAQAYVIAHEVGHHVQKLLGISDQVAAMRSKPNYNEYSVRLELQADFYAGVWAFHDQNNLKLTPEDIQEAMRAAYAIGDDAIQKKMQGKIVPHAFTHGTSEQRMRWFKKGFESGKIEEGDTFSMPYHQL